MSNRAIKRVNNFTPKHWVWFNINPKEKKGGCNTSKVSNCSLVGALKTVSWASWSSSRVVSGRLPHDDPGPEQEQAAVTAGRRSLTRMNSWRDWRFPLLLPAPMPSCSYSNWRIRRLRTEHHAASRGRGLHRCPPMRCQPPRERAGRRCLGPPGTHLTNRHGWRFPVLVPTWMASHSYAIWKIRRLGTDYHLGSRGRGVRRYPPLCWQPPREGVEDAEPLRAASRLGRERRG
jgi:hypothetical protein